MVKRVTREATPEFALERYTQQGWPDATFGRLGVVQTSFDDDVTDIIVQANGKIMAAGASNVATGRANEGLALARFVGGPPAWRS